MSSKKAFVIAFLVSLHCFASEKSICVQTFNAYGPAYAPWLGERTGALFEDLQSLPSCDIYQFQEVWREWHQNQFINNFYKLGDFIGLNPARKSLIGLMSFVKAKVIKQNTFIFKVNNEGSLLDDVRESFGVKKAFHVSQIKPNTLDEEIYLINTHLHPTSPAVRLTQILDIYNWRIKNTDKKFILNGDFNSGVDSLERSLLLYLLGIKDAADELNKYESDVRCTYCGSNKLSWLSGEHVFDYVFYSNIGMAKTRFEPKHIEVNLKGTEAVPLSDHYGLQSVLSIVSQNKVMSEYEYIKRINYLIRVIERAEEVLIASNVESVEAYQVMLEGIKDNLLRKNTQSPHYKYQLSFY